MSVLPDITRNYHRGSYNSEQANAAIQPQKKSLCDQIESYIESCGKTGATCQEAERDLGIKHQTCSARFTELRKAQRIYWNGLKRALPGSQPASAFVTIRGQLGLWEK